jgi:hypothetical protein
VLDGLLAVAIPERATLVIAMIIRERSREHVGHDANVRSRGQKRSDSVRIVQSTFARAEASAVHRERPGATGSSFAHIFPRLVAEGDLTTEKRCQ